MKNTPKFSVITPVHLWNDFRVEMFLKTLKSLEGQNFKDFEWVVIDDGSTMPFDWNILTRSKVKRITLIHKQHEERVIAYNSAFAVAQGEWFTLLDSDDEYKPQALYELNKAIEKYPKDKMFNFGCLYHHKDDTFTSRDPFTPARLPRGHEKFGGGNIVNGTFIWHRSVWEDMGGYPVSYIEKVDCSEINYLNGGNEAIRDLYMGSPYDFSAAAQLQYPEIREYFMVPDSEKGWKIIKELGNPWGQDYYLFYKYTRKYHSRVLRQHLYIVNPR